MPEAWHIAIDRGGTFTDAIAIRATPQGGQAARPPANFERRELKLLSEAPGAREDAPITAIRRLLKLAPGAPIPPGAIASVRLGTTVATNALLTGAVARVGLVITAGFGTVLEIGNQTRPALFALAIEKPAPLAAQVFEFAGRAGADGTQLVAPDWPAYERQLDAWQAAGIEAVAVALLHSSHGVGRAHELEACARARAHGFAYVAAGQALSPTPGHTTRAATAVLDAALTPVLTKYGESLARALPGVPLWFMRSSGGLAAPGEFSGRDALLSGPAGGVVGMAAIARAIGLPRVLGWDMGGTSTDVSHYGGTFQRTPEVTVAGAVVRAPCLRIETVAAGGGSCLSFADGRLQVGPQSAGANPGPVCYARGGPLALTDANLMLGRLHPEHFPRCFGPRGDQPLDARRVRLAFAALAGEVTRATGQRHTPESLAEGFVAIANATMARPIKALSTGAGRDIRDYALVAFGGAGPQHACALARVLGMRTVVLPALGSLLSAWGIALADRAELREAAVGVPLAPGMLPELQAHAQALAREARSALTESRREHDDGRGAGIPPAFRGQRAAQRASRPGREHRQGAGAPPAAPEQARVRVEVRLRYRATDSDLVVAAPALDDDDAWRDLSAWRAAFESEHRRRFGYASPDAELVVSSLLVEATQPSPVAALVRGDASATSRARQQPGDASATSRARQQAGARRPPLPANPRSLTVAARDDRCGSQPRAAERVPVVFEGATHQTPVLARDTLAVGAVVAGPALIVSADTTAVIEPGFQATMHAGGHLVLTWTPVVGRPAGIAGGLASCPPCVENTRRNEPASTAQPRRSLAPAAEAQATPAVPDPVRLELYHNRFMTIAAQMGAALAATARSVNIRERHDFSCAVFDAAGELVANAPHIPVHLGAMGASVQALAEAVRARLRPGEVYATNDPAAGGSHLPDITVIRPLFAADLGLAADDDDNDDDGAARRPLFWLANRGHHADVGGITPGSMPPGSRTLAEEGLCLHAVPLVCGGAFQEDALRARLAAGRWPVRRPDDLLADLRAQVAATVTGREELRRLVAERGLAEVRAYMRHIKDNAAACVSRALAALSDGCFADALDDGTSIRVRISVEPHKAAAREPEAEPGPDARRLARATIDFSGTGAALPGNLNAPRAVTFAAVLYVFRCLVDAPIPLNAGCLRPLRVVIPPGSLLDPPPGAAVAGGNVETSQRLVDVLLGACGVAAASQGTMNNLTFGDDARYQYYETIGGGAGATPDAPGASAVHTHMTNTRITDAEEIERRFPVRVWRFGVRANSGGAGRRRGGDGIVREFEFLAPLSVAMLSERRTRSPFGLAGGGAGARGVNLLIRDNDDTPRELPGKFALRVAPGARLLILTPGGGAYGAAE